MSFLRVLVMRDSHSLYMSYKDVHDWDEPCGYCNKGFGTHYECKAKAIREEAMVESQKKREALARNNESVY